MMYLRNTGYVILSIWLVGCLGNNNSNTSEGIKTTTFIQDSILEVDNTEDILMTNYPIAIGNDSCLVAIMRIPNTNGYAWSIRLDRLGKEVLKVPVSKAIVVDSNTSVYYQDSLHLKYIGASKIKGINYQFVRGSTLYFTINFENTGMQKEIFGRFNLYYGPKRRGEIYGLITDSIRSISSQ